MSSAKKLSTAIRAVVVLAFSLVLIIAALIFLLQAVAQFLVYLGLQPYLSSLIVGVVIAIIAGIAVWLALRTLSVSGLAPNRTIEQLRRNTDVIRDEVS